MEGQVLSLKDHTNTILSGTTEFVHICVLVERGTIANVDVLGETMNEGQAALRKLRAEEGERKSWIKYWMEKKHISRPEAEKIVNRRMAIKGGLGSMANAGRQFANNYQGGSIFGGSGDHSAPKPRRKGKRQPYEESSDPFTSHI